MSLQSLRQQLSQRAHPDSMSTWSASIRVGVFAILELVWIVLAVVCHLHVIEIGDGQILRIKTIWTTFAVLYQVIATAPLAGVLAYAFSCEWSRRGPQSQSRGSIAVSSLTAGLMDRGIYALFKRASLQFILAFIASLLATILSAVAPATISINPILLNRPTTLSVGSFDDLDPTATIAGAFLSNALVFMEQIQNVSYGFDMPPGVLFGMPGRGLLGQNLSWTYDVVYYNYTCTYRAPTYQLFDQGNPVWDRIQWVVDGEIYESDSSVASARPTLADRTGFFETGYDISPLSGIWPLTSSNEGSNGTLAWLFIGINNATYGHDQYYSDIPWRVEFLSLQNLPTKNTTYNGTGFSDLWPVGTPTTGNASTEVLAVNASYSNTASILLCDPHIRNETRLISLVDETFTVGEPMSQDDAVYESSQDYGPDGAGTALSTILNPLLGGNTQKFSARRSPDNNITLSMVNWAAGNLTLQALNDSGDYFGVAHYDTPLPPDVIASNIGRYVQSAAKAYLVQGLLPISGLSVNETGAYASNAQQLLAVTVMQTSLEQMFATVGLVVLILTAVISLLFVGIGNLPLTVSTVETVLQGKENISRERVANNISYESVPLRPLSE
ncbi:hypothetical protein HWV62_9833 [Athelia sp. TMB]|nr:hypothetical protein HWV62_9833 [Athelia sp. TMB]